MPFSPLFILTILAVAGLALTFIDWQPQVDTQIDPANAAALGVGLAAVAAMIILVRTGHATWKDFIPKVRRGD